MTGSELIRMIQKRLDGTLDAQSWERLAAFLVHGREQTAAAAVAQKSVEQVWQPYRRWGAAGGRR
jgi:hypothetical protein